MPTKLEFQDARLISCVELDKRTVLLTVLESWVSETKRWLRVTRTESECVKGYTLNIGVGRWHDGSHYVIKPNPVHFRLMELWAGWMAERKLDAFIENDMPAAAPAPSRGPLPPVPVFATRRAIRRLNS